MDCTYCYVYNLGDDSWMTQPRRMAEDVVASVADQLGQLSHAQDRAISVVLHGGEPLLLGLERTDHLLRELRTHLRDDAGLHIQTNGVLLTDEFIDLFDRHDVGVSISLDGPAELHDLNRTDRRGEGSHERVVAGVSRLVAHPAGQRLLTGLLAVVDPTSEPAEVYEFLKATGAPSIDFLYRDGNHDGLPPGKAGTGSTEYGEWMVRLLDHYFTDTTPPRVRVIDDLVRLVLGGVGRKEGVGEQEYGILVIDTDGTITRNDTLKAAYPGADRFALSKSILDRKLLQQLSSQEFEEYFGLQHPTSPMCQACQELSVCGGGMPAHRWSDRDGYANPTVYCADQLLLISTIRARVAGAASLGAETGVQHEDRIAV